MPDNTDADAIEAAARILEQGGLVAFPTETVYGLGADAENQGAVAAIYEAKGRPANHPLIVHLATGADPEYWSSNVNVSAQKIIASFWPGPLTLILSRAAHIPDTVAGGQSSIGLRCPAHPIAQALLQAFKAGKGGIAAPSANRFGHVSPTTARHVVEEFRDTALVRCVLEGGQSAIGIESTILDLSRGRPVLLRPGGISAQQIAELLGVMPELPDVQAPRVSGSLASHYAPRTPLVVVPSAQLSEVLEKLHAAGRRVALMHTSGFAPADLSNVVRFDQHALATRPLAQSFVNKRMSSEPGSYAHDLYAILRELDHVDAELIVMEALPDTDAWRAVGDRVARAAHGSCGVLERMIES